VCSRWPAVGVRSWLMFDGWSRWCGADTEGGTAAVPSPAVSQRGATTHRSLHSKLAHRRAAAPTLPTNLGATSTTRTCSSTAPSGNCAMRLARLLSARLPNARRNHGYYRAIHDPHVVGLARGRCMWEQGNAPTGTPQSTECVVLHPWVRAWRPPRVGFLGALSVVISCCTCVPTLTGKERPP